MELARQDAAAGTGWGLRVSSPPPRGSGSADFLSVLLRKGGCDFDGDCICMLRSPGGSPVVARALQPAPSGDNAPGFGGGSSDDALFAAIRARKEKQEKRAAAIAAGELTYEDPRERREREAREAEKAKKGGRRGRKAE